MNTNEIENMKNMENNENIHMDEKVHYEIKFVETEDGYRLEASGDKRALKRLGIGPHMVGRKRKGGHRGRREWARARHARRMVPRQRRRAAVMARRQGEMPGPDRFAHAPGSDCFDFAEGLHRRSHRMHGRHDKRGQGQPPEKHMPDIGQNTWDW